MSVSQSYTLSGKVLHNRNKTAVEHASVFIDDGELWAMTDDRGFFVIRNIPKGSMEVTIRCLGYAGQVISLDMHAHITDTVFFLREDNLMLDEVTVAAKSRQDESVTSYMIDRAGLEHLQMLHVTDVLALLPGGQTNRTLHPASDAPQRIALRSSSAPGAGSEMGNPSFGTSIEVDGVRLSNNASLDRSTSGTLYGIDTRNIASGNIESIELITGVASVAYGDMTNGVVKINTKKGKSPLTVEMTSKPHTKHIAAGRGFTLGAQGGVLNAGLEYTRSISSPASPYTSYDRNGLSLLYENTLNKNGRPLMISSGITGNIGGYDSKADPDAFKDTYEKERDNTLRAHFKLNYLLNTPLITSIELAGTISHSDRLRKENVRKSSSSSSAAIHTKEEGYFVAGSYDDNPLNPVLLIPPGYWYELKLVDSKPLSLTGNLKLKQARRFGRISSNLMLGIDFSRSGNRGKGVYYDDMRHAPTWREYRYDALPFMNSLSGYLEEKLTLPAGMSILQLTAGVRTDMTLVGKSEYGTVSSFSPRVNAKYILRNTPDRLVERFNLRAGWGKFVKLPSLSILYPDPAYRDILSFAPGALADGSVFYAYYVMPRKLQYNPELRWQYNNQLEAGFEMRIRGATISFSAYRHKTFDSYRQITEYLPFSYKLTGQEALEDCPIPSSSRQYAIHPTTGIVTVFDKTGQYPSQELAFKERNTFKSVYRYANASPFTRKGVEWIVDFDKIQALQTSVRWDGCYYNYRGTDETLDAHSPVSQNMADGNPYKYVGIYVGGESASNGYEARRLNTNLTFTTHIPAVRLIFSLKIESSLYNYTQRLSEYEGNVRGFATENRDSYFPAGNSPGNIYNSNRYVSVYPLYYVAFDDMQTRIPFAEKLAWARDSDQALYYELVKLVTSSNTDYYFNAARLSGYYSANISITKEIGNIASLSFNALNFTNNMQLIKSSDTGFQSTVFGSSHIPNFYYGLSLKIKINNKF
jgi:hypothetical protein